MSKGYFCPAGTSEINQHPCPGGTYSNNTQLTSKSECNDCEIGHYCPSGSLLPIKCPAGTYSNDTNNIELYDCEPCTAGFACPDAGTTVPTTTCAHGHYCPDGTIYPRQYSCPAGTYYDDTNAINIEDCITCPAGKYCKIGTTGDDQSNPASTCPKGHYCPTGTTFDKQYPCPAGYYSTNTGNQQLSDCDICDAGYFVLVVVIH